MAEVAEQLGYKLDAGLTKWQDNEANIRNNSYLMGIIRRMNESECLFIEQNESAK